MSRNIVIVGAGPGGLAAGMLLSSKGYEVDIFEKQSFVGGRNGSITEQGFTFDIGPTFLSMPEIAMELFEMAGRDLADYIDLKELDLMYELIFEGKAIKMFRTKEKMINELEKHFPGSSKGYVQFMKDTKVKMDKLKPILQNRMDKIYHYISPRVLKALPRLSLGKSVYEVLSDYFQEEELKFAFTFQSKYLGMSPWECPGAFSILSFMEHEYGIFHPIGGVNRLSKAMTQVVEENGGRIHLNRGVRKLLLNGKKAVEGVLLEDGTKVSACHTVINGDFAHSMTNLVDDGVLKRFSKSNLRKKKYSCSTFMIYLGLDKKYDLPHHTVCFSEDYRRNVEEITNSMILSGDPSIYVQNACATDETLAPLGKSTLYILAPVPNNMSGIDWSENKAEFRNLVLKTLEEKTQFKDIQDHIEFEKIISPVSWEKDFFIYEGATFNLGHQLSQMMALRPPNKFKELKNCWLVGGGTHPGSGLPTILESARITTGLLTGGDKNRREEVL
ncbi:phytoene desaturase family protein [Falsibacillus albus]|uniref:Phytoene desaturase n=1 Tax=Falsibacillus albus TaxID=2478915 RepID=A0A3L7K4P4_9BACI|nr:phytoene desaturase family protein [Falsibacillus albus]RLQ97234.1 phytoene desaturase [Falsibacillus albus]